jgi:uncharacterized protein (TIGR02145 family)
MTENLATTKNQKRGTTLTKNNTSSFDPYYSLPATNNTIATQLTEADAQNSNYFGNNEGKPGFFYNWAAAVGAESGTAAQNTTSYPACNDCNPPVGTVNVATQDICPTGWHLPSDWEWNNLEKEITTGYTQYSTASTAPTTWNDTWRTNSSSYLGGHGTLMRNPTNIDLNQSPAGLSNPKEKGFSGLLVGQAWGEAWYFYGNTASYWSNSSSDDSGSWIRGLNAASSGCLRDRYVKGGLISVRCKKDE